MMVFLTRGRAALHTEGWELLTEAEGQAEGDRQAEISALGTQRAVTEATLAQPSGVEEPKLMA